MSRRAVSLAAVLLALTACGNDDASGATDAPTQAPPTTAAPAAATTRAPPVTTTIAENAVLCDAFLAFRGAQDVETMTGALETLTRELGTEVPDDVAAAIVAFQTGEFGDLGVGGAISAMRDHIIPLCRQRYYDGVVGAANNETAAQEFFDAVVAGDRIAAGAIAHDEVIAQFEPWEPVGGEPTIEIGSDGFTMRLGPDAAVSCETQAGVVERCRYGPST